MVPAGELMDKAMAWVEKMSAGGRLALWQAKKVLDREGGMSQERAQDLEAECFATCFSTRELHNRVQEYVSRRTAVTAPAEAPEPAEEEEPAREEPSADDFFE